MKPTPVRATVLLAGFVMVNVRVAFEPSSTGFGANDFVM